MYEGLCPTISDEMDPKWLTSGCSGHILVRVTPNADPDVTEEDADAVQ
jgi:hypothetical protein